MKVNGKDYRTVWWKENRLFLIDQTKLPFKFEIFESKNHVETAKAIKDMIVRGAGAIGTTAGFGMAQAFNEANDENLWEYVHKAMQTIESTRPTAQNLFYATRRVYNAAKDSEYQREVAVKVAQKIADEDAENCRKIGENGAQLIKDGMCIETHCNAGWLAFVDFGTALSPIYVAHRAGKNIFVYADETRPRSQGAFLTAWELSNENVPHKIIPDNAGAHLMSHGKIDMIIVGSDRIAANGDVANKIGTLEKAIAARLYNVPFYVAAPTSTIDINCPSGKEIPIEERGQDEVLYMSGYDEDTGDIKKVRVASPNSEAMNPAFDVTPANLVAGIITEKGIVEASESGIKKLF